MQGQKRQTTKGCKDDKKENCKTQEKDRLVV